MSSGVSFKPISPRRETWEYSLPSYVGGGETGHGTGVRSQ